MSFEGQEYVSETQMTSSFTFADDRDATKSPVDGSNKNVVLIVMLTISVAALIVLVIAVIFVSITVNVEIFAWVIFAIFALVFSSGKLPYAKNKTHMPL